MNLKTQKKALAALDGMAQIVKREMLTRGEYVTDDVDEAKVGQLCEGRQYCAIGSLWVGAGIKAEVRDADTHWPYVMLPGASQRGRRMFLRNRPALRQALDALNGAALAWIKRHNPDLDADMDFASFDDPIEGLFEATTPDTVGRKEMLRIIASARRRIRSAK